MRGAVCFSTPEQERLYRPCSAPRRQQFGRGRAARKGNTCHIRGNCLCDPSHGGPQHLELQFNRNPESHPSRQGGRWLPTDQKTRRLTTAAPTEICGEEEASMPNVRSFVATQAVILSIATCQRNPGSRLLRAH